MYNALHVSSFLMLVYAAIVCAVVSFLRLIGLRGFCAERSALRASTHAETSLKLYRVHLGPRIIDFGKSPAFSLRHLSDFEMPAMVLACSVVIRVSVASWSIRLPL